MSEPDTDKGYYEKCVNSICVGEIRDEYYKNGECPCLGWRSPQRERPYDQLTGANQMNDNEISHIVEYGMCIVCKGSIIPGNMHQCTCVSTKTIKPKPSCSTCGDTKLLPIPGGYSFNPCPDCQEQKQPNHDEIRTPKRIYLQIDNGSDLPTTWSDDGIYDTDIEYIRSDIHDTQVTELQEKLKVAEEINKLAFSGADYRRRHQFDLIYEEIELNKVSPIKPKEALSTIKGETE